MSKPVSAGGVRMRVGAPGRWAGRPGAQGAGALLGAGLCADSAVASSLLSPRVTHPSTCPHVSGPFHRL